MVDLLGKQSGNKFLNVIIMNVYGARRKAV
jgi:hypothetical protein